MEISWYASPLAISGPYFPLSNGWRCTEIVGHCGRSFQVKWGETAAFSFLCHQMPSFAVSLRGGGTIWFPRVYDYCGSTRRAQWANHLLVYRPPSDRWKTSWIRGRRSRLISNAM